MSSLAFVTHPSVRIKGSENVYNPVQCMDELCPIKTAHFHCPFCVKTESYTDPVILKAHYRVKHVDKGIEFAGLKILRCCEHCDIIGVIKGEKKFKGAHWHCYRCRNGFNRRDEAIKHYKTHFRNPQTTFQISITQDLNNPVAYSQEPRHGQAVGGNMQTPHSDRNSLLNNTEIIHPALTEAVSSISPLAVSEQDIMSNSTMTLTNGKVQDGEVHVSIEAAGDSVDMTEEDEPAIVIIQEEQLETSEIDSSFPTHIINNESVVSESNEQDKVLTPEEHIQRLEQEKAVLKAKVTKLLKHIEKLEETVMRCKRREEELTSRLSNATDRGIAELLKRMEADHRTLLRQQLDMLQQVSTPARSPPSTVLQLTDQHGQEIQVVNAASLEAFLAGNITTTTTSQGQTNLPTTTTIIQSADLSLEHISGQETKAVVSSSDVPVSSDVELNPGYVMCVQNLKTEKEDSQEFNVKVSSEKVSEVAVSVPDASTTDSQEPPSKKHKVK